MNTNTSSGVQTLPNQIFNTTGEVLLQYTGGSTPALATGATLVEGLTPDLPTNGSFDGRSTRLILCGVNSAPAGTVAIRVYVGTTLSGTKIVTLGPVAPSGGNGNFSMDLLFLWDSASKSIGGYFRGFINGVGFNTGTGNLLATGIATQDQVQFVASAQFSSASASNIIGLRGFYIDLI